MIKIFLLLLDNHWFAQERTGLPLVLLSLDNKFNATHFCSARFKINIATQQQEKKSTITC
jgi:hypothetical protein